MIRWSEALYIACIIGLLIILSTGLTGCAGASTYRAAIAHQGAQVADQALIDSEWLLCRAATVGAWVRRYGSDPQRAAGWRALCAESIPELPVEASK